MTRRAGMSLTEVLVALFVMALGTISILTLFPIGALNVGQALKDDRTAQAVMQADAFMRTNWQLNVIENQNDTSVIQAFTNPSGVSAPSKSPSLFPVTSGPGNPSYPVVVDPMGFVARGGPPDQNWVANQAGNANLLPNLTRQNLFVVQSSGNPNVFATRLCSLMDGFTYSPNGSANPTPGGQIEREIRYNWFWVLQQPDTSNPNSANMTVAVFDKRAPLFAPAAAEQFFVPVACSPGSSVVSFPSSVATGNAPPVQKGSWLLDATVTLVDSSGNVYVPPNPVPDGGPPKKPQPTPVVRNANFYRVVSAIDNGTTVDVELQTPLLPDTVTPALSGLAPAAPGHRRFIVLAGLSEVFQRPPLP